MSKVFNSSVLWKVFTVLIVADWLMSNSYGNRVVTASMRFVLGVIA